MKKFMALYSGGKAPATQEEGMASMKVWTEWYHSLGGAVADMGAPFAESLTLTGHGHEHGHGGNVSNGYGVFHAEDLHQAAALVEHCPILSEGGKVHLFELMAM